MKLDLASQILMVLKSGQKGLKGGTFQALRRGQIDTNYQSVASDSSPFESLCLSPAIELTTCAGKLTQAKSMSFFLLPKTPLVTTQWNKRGGKVNVDTLHYTLFLKHVCASLHPPPPRPRFGRLKLPHELGVIYTCVNACVSFSKRPAAY